MRLKIKGRDRGSTISPNIDRIPKSKLDIEKGHRAGKKGEGASRSST